MPLLKWCHYLLVRYKGVCVWLSPKGKLMHIRHLKQTIPPNTCLLCDPQCFWRYSFPQILRVLCSQRLLVLMEWRRAWNWKMGAVKNYGCLTKKCLWGCNPYHLSVSEVREQILRRSPWLLFRCRIQHIPHCHNYISAGKLVRIWVWDAHMQINRQLWATQLCTGR